MIHGSQKPRTREDKASALAARLIMSRPERIRELVGEHTAETFAKAHGIPVGMIRETFDRAKGSIA